MLGRLMHSQLRSGSGRDNIMANTLLRLTVLAFLAGYVAGASVPSAAFRFSYTQPGDGTVSQFYSGPSDSLVYQYGYQFPGQQHSEQKTRDGQVTGDYAFTNANGDVQEVKYRAGPGVGFTDEQAAVARSGAVSNVVPAQATFDGLVAKSDIVSDPDFAAAYPQLLASVRSGKLEPFQLLDGQQAFRVSASFVAESRGSVSELANRLDVDLFAPRHDQQVPSHPGSPRNSQSDGSSRAVLETAELPDGTPIFLVKTFPTS